MRHPYLTSRTVFACALILILGTARPAAASSVDAGWDLLATDPPTHFRGVPLLGVPLGTFDFGGTIGVQDVGETDTIIRRLGPGVVPHPPGSDTIPVELVALQLQSVAPIDLGPSLGTRHIFIRLPSPCTGQMNIHFDHTGNGGTFNSFFDVFFEVRLDSLNGPFFNTGQLRLQSSGTRWGRTPPPGAIQIPGVNVLPNPFWPEPITAEMQVHRQRAGLHVARTSIVPLPAAAWGGMVLLVGVVAHRCRRRF